MPHATNASFVYHSLGLSYNSGRQYTDKIIKFSLDGIFLRDAFPASNARFTGSPDGSEAWVGWIASRQNFEQ